MGLAAGVSMSGRASHRCGSVIIASATAAENKRNKVHADHSHVHGEYRSSDVACSSHGKRAIGTALVGLCTTTTRSFSAAARGETESAYDSYARTYDELDGGKLASFFGFPSLREQLLESATGSVLECGAGTGINLNFYNPKKVDDLTMVDISSGMLDQARQKASLVPTTYVRATVQQLPFANDSFDTVSDTFSFCVYDSVEDAMGEIVRVLKPGGTMLLLEHTRSPNAALGWYQDVTAAPVRATGKACTWNQRIVDAVVRSGMVVELADYKLLGTIVSIVARKPL